MAEKSTKEIAVDLTYSYGMDQETYDKWMNGNLVDPIAAGYVMEDAEYTSHFHNLERRYSCLLRITQGKATFDVTATIGSPYLEPDQKPDNSLGRSVRRIIRYGTASEKDSDFWLAGRSLAVIGKMVATTRIRQAHRLGTKLDRIQGWNFRKDNKGLVYSFEVKNTYVYALEQHNQSYWYWYLLEFESGKSLSPMLMPYEPAI